MSTKEPVNHQSDVRVVRFAHPKCMAAAGAFGYDHPGRAGCKINYSQDEAVVRSTRRDSEGCSKFKRRRKPLETQWDSSVYMNAHKYNVDFSDCRMANMLGSEHVNMKDFRKIKGTTYVYDKNGSHAFTRGDVVTGWNHSTAFRCKENRLIAGQPSKEVLPADYISPVEREEQFLEECRTRKRSVDNHYATLIEKYGPEGAEAMKHIESMKRITKHKKGKATAEDLTAVRELDTREVSPPAPFQTPFPRAHELSTPSSPDTEGP